jgi:drug/metabolite transporter (DMT)-like permease
MLAAFSLAVVIVSSVAYHLAQKTSSGSNPWPLLAIAYAVALALSIALSLFANGAARLPVRAEWAAGLVLGAAVFGIEAGFFFLYRAGWPLASASMIANISVAAILAAVGILAFGEELTAVRATGLAFAATGAILLSRG